MASQYRPHPACKGIPSQCRFLPVIWLLAPLPLPQTCPPHPLQAARGLFSKHAIEPLDSQHSSLGRLDAGGVLADAGAMAALMLPADSWDQAGMCGRAPGEFMSATLPRRCFEGQDVGQQIVTAQL